MNTLKVALVHDYLREYGGAERVLEALHELFPDAPVYTAFIDPDALGRHWKRFEDWNIVESVAAKIPFIKHNKVYSPLRVLSSYFFEGFDLCQFDVVISSTNMYMAKAVITRPETLHICYCHTPPRSLYGYSTMTDWKKNWLIRLVGEAINVRMRQIDALTAKRPDVLVANSQETQRRIAKFYRRDSVVIYPPVDLPQSQKKEKNTKPYYLYVGRLAKSKHADLAILACQRLGKKLKIVGAGKGEEHLRSLLTSTSEWLGAVSDSELSSLYANATALIFPAQDEDFGIVPVEAQLFGTPVIAHFSGGSKETVIDNKTGVVFQDLTVESVVHAIHKLESLSLDPASIQHHAKRFSTKRFHQEIQELIEKNLAKKKA